MKYDDFIHKIIEEVETEKDIIISNYSKGKPQCDSLFEISDTDDKLYQAIISGCNNKIRIIINNIIPTLCAEYDIPCGQKDETRHHQPFDFKTVINGKEHFIRLIYNRSSFNYDSFRRLICGFNDYSSPIDLVFLLKNTYESIQYINSFSQRLNEQSDLDFNCYLFEDYLELLFGSNERQKFHEAMHDFSKEMHEAIGYQITDICSPHNLEKLKESLNEEILEYDYAGIKDQKYAEASEQYDHPRHLTQRQFENIKKVYLDSDNNGQSGRYKLLLGNADFADSFLTSEWLYKRYILSENKYDSLSELDNTFIVDGYLKSIEQLLWDIIWLIGQGKQIKRKSSYSEVAVDENNLNRIDTTLGALIGFIDEYANDDSIFRQLAPREHRNSSQDGNYVITYISIQINDWKNKNRNGYFHKDNLRDTEKVSVIRDDTYYLYMLILGTVQLNEEQIRELS